MTWKPTQEDLAWAKSHLASFKEGGQWYIPASGNFYHISHEKKEVALVKGEIDETHIQNRICFSALGYNVVDRRNQTLTSVDVGEHKVVALTVDCDNAALLKFVESMEAAVVQSGKGFIFTVSGFDDDSRELWEIPEVIGLYKRLFETGFASCLEVTTSLFEYNPLGFGAFEAWAAIQGYLVQEKRQWVNDNIKNIFPVFLKELEKSNVNLRRYLHKRIEGQNRIKKFKG